MAGDLVSGLNFGAYRSDEIIDCAEAAFEALAMSSLNPSSEGLMDALADAYLPIPPLALWLSKRERRY